MLIYQRLSFNIQKGRLFMAEVGALPSPIHGIFNGYLSSTLCYMGIGTKGLDDLMGLTWINMRINMWINMD